MFSFLADKIHLFWVSFG